MTTTIKVVQVKSYFVEVPEHLSTEMKTDVALRLVGEGKGCGGIVTETTEEVKYHKDYVKGYD